jgi:hypothetical protein
MRALIATVVLGVVSFCAAPAAAQLPPPSAPPAGGSPAAAEPSGLPPPAPAPGAPVPAPGGAGGGGIPSPSTTGLPLPEAQALSGTPNPSSLTPSATDEWRFTWHGFTRTPMRIGFGKRPQCPPGTMAGASLTPSGGIPKDIYTAQAPCATQGQPTTSFHTPFAPDTQYLDWRYDRQQEYDWTEIFMNYGNSKITGTVGIMGFGFSDAEYFNSTNAATQFGIAQAYFTVHPDLGLANVRLTWKIGAFQDRYGMAAQYDAGPYDTYMFGRTHQMGESLALEVDADDWTFRISHGFGTRAEQIQFTPLQFGAPNSGVGSESNFPGFTLLNHIHAGLSFKKKLDVNAHLITSFAQDYRAVGFLNGSLTEGHIDVYGLEATLKMGPIGGRLYAAYSHMQAVNPQVVGPANEAVHSIGGGNYESANGILENFLGCDLGPMPSGQGTNFNGNCATVQNSVGAAHGSVDTIELYYDYSVGSLIRHLSDVGGAWDVRLALFGMYSSVSSDLKPSMPGDMTPGTTGSFMLGDGVKKLKYGGDLIITPLDWMGIGVRADLVQPTNFDKEQSFFVISPKIMLHTKFASHEEFTLWYSHYSYGQNVLPQPPNGIHNPNPIGTCGPFPPDDNVVGIKGTMWW